MKPGRGRKVGGAKSGGFAASKKPTGERPGPVRRGTDDAEDDRLFDRVQAALRQHAARQPAPLLTPRDSDSRGTESRGTTPRDRRGDRGNLVQEVHAGPHDAWVSEPSDTPPPVAPRKSLGAALSQSLGRWSLFDVDMPDLTPDEDAMPWYIINPNWQTKVRWDILCGVLIIYSVLSIPYHLAFDQPAEGALATFNFTVDGFFMLDLILCFFTAIPKENGELTTRLAEIQVTYMKGWLIVDLASCFPFDQAVALAQQDSSDQPDDLRSLRIIRVVRLTRLLKLARLFKISRVLASIEEQLRIPHSLIKLLKLFGNVVIFMHYISCLWFFMGCPDGQAEQNGVMLRCGADKRAERLASGLVDPLDDSWVHVYDVQDFTPQQQYLACFYYVAATIMGVGYGDISPQSAGEKILSILVMLLGATFFGLILGQITAMIQSINPRAADQRRRLSMVREWMFHRDVPKLMRRKVRAHYEYIFSKAVQQTETAMLDQVPERMKTSLAKTMHSSELACFRFLQRPQSFTTRVVFQLRPFVVAMDEAIVIQHDAVFDFYMVMSGVVVGVDGGQGHVAGAKKADESRLQRQLSMALGGARKPEGGATPVQVPRLDSRGVVRAIYAKGDHFAEGPMWNQEPSPLGYTAATVCDLFFLPRASLLPALEAEPAVKKGFEVQVSSHARLIKKALSEKQLFVPGGGVSTDLAWKMGRRIVWAGELVCLKCGSQPSSPVARATSKSLASSRSARPSPAKRMTLARSPSHRRHWLEDSASTGPNPGELSPVDFDPEADKKRGRRTMRPMAAPMSPIMSPPLSPKSPLSPTSPGSPQPGSPTGGPGDLPSDITGALSTKLDEGTYEADEFSELLARWIIPAAHPKKVSWDMFVAFLIVYSAIVIPYRIGFSQPDEEPDPTTTIVDAVIDCLFGLDIVVSFRTSFTDPKSATTVKEISLIRMNYITGWFSIDFFSTVPFDLIAKLAVGQQAGEGLRSMRLIKMARLFRLLKLVRLLKMMKLVTIIQRNIDLDPMVWQLVKLAINMFAFAHLIGCFWFLLTHQVEANPGPWPEERGGAACELGRLHCHSYPEEVSGMDWWSQSYGDDYLEPRYKQKQFIASLYWAFTTMTTVGYGDITPVGMAERIYSIVTMFLGTTLFGYTVGSIASILEKRVGADVHVKKRVKGYRDYLMEGTTAIALLNPIVKDYEFRMLSANTLGDADSIFGELSPQVRTQLTMHVYAKVLDRISLFSRESAHDSVAAYLVPLLRPQLYVQGDTILPPFTRLSSLIYVSEGVAEELEAERKFRALTTRPIMARSRTGDSVSWHPTARKVDQGEAFRSCEEYMEFHDKPREQLAGAGTRWYKLSDGSGWVPAFDLPEDLPSAPRIGDPGCGPAAKPSDEPVVIEEELESRQMYVRGLYWPGEHSLLAPSKIKHAAHGVLTTPTFVRSATTTVSTYAFDLYGGMEDLRSLPKRVIAHIVQVVARELASHDTRLLDPSLRSQMRTRKQELMTGHSEKELSTIEQPDWAVKAGIEPRVWGGRPIPGRPAPPQRRRDLGESLQPSLPSIAESST